MPQSHILQFFGGLAFFFYGLFITHQSLQSYAGDRLKSMVAKATQSRFRALVTGILVTFFFQSSSATTVMTVGLTSSGLLGLEQAMAVALGAGIGTTIVVLLFAVQSITQYGLLFVIIGLLLRFLFSKRAIKMLGEILLGFGMVFFGMVVMAQATAPLQTYPLIPDFFAFMQNYPLATLLIAAVVTALVHSSGVIFGILISLAYAGAITFPVALPMVLGANLGTSFTAILATTKAKTDGKRIAWANLLLRVGAVLMLLPFLGQVSTLVEYMSHNLYDRLFGIPSSVANEIALSHFFFNVFVAAVFLPLLPFGKKLICWLIPVQHGEEEVFGPKYLDKNALVTPSLAFAQVTRELVRTGEIVQQMFRDVLSLFHVYDFDKMTYLESRDHEVDTLYKAIKFYLARLQLENLKEEEADMGIQLITAANELESIGDTIDKHLLRLAHKKWNKRVEFSEEGWKEICEMHTKTAEMMELATVALASSSGEFARKVEHHFTYYTDREDQLKMSHLKRLHQGLQESILTSSMHLELMSIFHQINISILMMIDHLLPGKVREAAPSLS